jgi:hypothetical protein
VKGRFVNHELTKMGRIGHPVAVTRKLVKCAGVAFEDRATNKRWTFRMYEAYGDEWPAMDIWTVQVLTYVNSKERNRGMAYGPQTPVDALAVPEEVRDHAMAELVKLRLRGAIRA